MDIGDLDPATRYLIEKRRRLRTVMTALPAVVAILLWLLATGLDERYLEYMWGIRRDLLLLIVVTLFAFSALSLILTYLQTGFRTDPEFGLESLRLQEERDARTLEARDRSSESSQKLESQLKDLRLQFQETKAAVGNLDDASRAQLVAELRKSLQSEAASAVIEEIRAQAAADQSKIARDTDLASRLDESRTRLQRELDALGRRGNLNLGLGAVTTVIGIGLLGFSVFAEVSAAKDLWTLASHFAPRLALVLLIELFAFFFLSLYKSSLSEIKYFQNEITNIEARQLALRAAISTGESALLSEVVGKLASTERNHILSKDQTTVELEKVRIDRDSHTSLLKTLSELFPKKA